MLFSVCFTKFKVKKYKQKQTKRKTSAKEKLSAFVCFFSSSYRATGSVNCARADRVTTDRYRGHFRFLEMLKECVYLSLNPAFFKEFRYEPTLEIGAMHSFCKITLFF